MCSSVNGIACCPYRFSASPRFSCKRWRQRCLTRPYDQFVLSSWFIASLITSHLRPRFIIDESSGRLSSNLHFLYLSGCASAALSEFRGDLAAFSRLTDASLRFRVQFLGALACTFGLISGDADRNPCTVCKSSRSQFVPSCLRC